MLTNTFLFVGYPYLMMVLAVLVSIIRYRYTPFSFSSLSSQFLENDQLYWGSNLWHWGIIIVLLGHFFAFLMPSVILAWNAQPVRLFLLEATGLAMAMLALLGIVGLIVRRLYHPRIKVVTTSMDVIILVLLLVQVTTGIDTALRYRWGSSWYATNAAPYLQSLFFFNPKPQYVMTLPIGPKIHMLSAFTIIGLIPFTRLVHFLVVPLHYLWRTPQLVIWNRRPARRLDH
jgi:nitrate reductase gamma subunit